MGVSQSQLESGWAVAVSLKPVSNFWNTCVWIVYSRDTSCIFYFVFRFTLSKSNLDFVIEIQCARRPLFNVMYLKSWPINYFWICLWSTINTRFAGTRYAHLVMFELANMNKSIEYQQTKGNSFKRNIWNFVKRQILMLNFSLHC